MNIRRKRWLRRSLLGLAGLCLGLLTVVVVDGWRAFGKRATGARRERLEASPRWKDGHLVNPEPLENDHLRALVEAFAISPHVRPVKPPPVEPDAARALATPPASGLRATWLGHSTVLVEIDGKRVLTDPIWSERASPLSWLGPRRWYAPPIELSALGPIDLVVVSHDHYDHLDQPTIVAIAAQKSWNTKFVVPLGVGAHLAYWGVPAAQIVELDWWDRTRVGNLEVVATPARHASGRLGFDNDSKLWAGYGLLSAEHRVYYSGDTGLFPALREIGERLGPFDLTMIEVGQYGSAWPDWHLGPEQAVRAHQMVRGRVLLPVHWGTFALAYHGWTEPIERALAAGAALGVALVVPRPGQSFEPETPPPLTRWWPDLPWRSGTEDPIVSTQMD